MRPNSVSSVTNMRTSDQAQGVTLNTASGSRPGEDNSRHVALAILAIGGLVLLAGLVNVRLGVGIGKG